MTHEFDDGPSEWVDSLDAVTPERLRRGSVRLRKSDVAGAPGDWGMGFERSLLSFPKDANVIYRDGASQNSIQVRAYDDHYEFQLDHANPEEGGNPITHLLRDISPDRRRALAVGAGILALLVTILLWIG